AQCCQAAEDTVDAYMHSVSTALGVGELSAEEFHEQLVQKMGFDREFGLFIDLYASGIQRNEEALAYAVSLQQRPDVTVGIISNTNAAHVLWLDEHVPELVEFDLVIMSNEVAMIKPDARIFELAMELLNVLPEQCIFIDDLAENVAAAQTLGLAGIVHTDWQLTRPQLEAWLTQSN
ncbi:MAG: HAD family phosphatase, partial [Caldilineaceae bacterium]|nr:HAD family phosphatase [Caldilineaceae bacterium]